MEERLMHIWCFVCISINKYSCSCVYEEPYMANKDKFYVVFVGRRWGVYTTWFEGQTQIIGYKDNV